DTGVIYLMDDRFTRPEVQSLLPAWWRVAQIARFLPGKPEKASKLAFLHTK
ncbi:MAG: hypothetical protein HQ446_08160, partial [Polaromonas sp.]|nr:hypothetical protein [Polaromonas sp.]